MIAIKLRAKKNLEKNIALEIEMILNKIVKRFYKN